MKQCYCRERRRALPGVCRERSGFTLVELMTVIAGRLGREAYATGNVDGGLYPVGPAMGLIHDVPTCAEIIQGMVAGAVKG